MGQLCRFAERSREPPNVCTHAFPLHLKTYGSENAAKEKSGDDVSNTHGVSGVVHQKCTVFRFWNCCFVWIRRRERSGRAPKSCMRSCSLADNDEIGSGCLTHATLRQNFRPERTVSKLTCRCETKKFSCFFLLKF